jgi:hypothetical protein
MPTVLTRPVFVVPSTRRPPTIVTEPRTTMWGWSPSRNVRSCAASQTSWTWTTASVVGRLARAAGLEERIWSVRTASLKALRSTACT